ncbi:MAG: alanine--tRNA ligase, partial [Deltaproteobacteria bacterium]|nr:alanine--tRNA ligase [Deltaproteobacteria bacterium]
AKKYAQDKKQDVAFRVIADHARATAFLIGDGILPSNEGRGYVLRRIIRRAIRFGQILDLKHSFLRPVCTKVTELMGRDYEDLVRSKSFIEGVVNNEEKRFADTLHYSMKVLDEEIEKLKAEKSDTIPGDVAFKLYDTYGLSVDIVEDVARDENLRVDMEGFDQAMSKQKTQSQESWKGSGEEDIPAAFRGLMARGLSSRFLGYETLDSKAKVTAVLVDGKETRITEKGARAEVVLEQTPFYGEAGGQAGDTGWITNEGVSFRVTNTLKYSQDIIVHKGHLEAGNLSAGDQVETRVDEDKRKATSLNHTATHLLHTALREVLGDHVKQAGSLVSPDRLRFDFSHFTQVSPDTLKEVEYIVNRHIRENLPLETNEMSKEEAMKTGAMAIFEERYGETVRLVRIGDDVSMELCGGTHTERTGDIGLFRIVSESAVAANVRRIEARTGEAALRYDQEQENELKLVASLLKTAPDKIGERLERLLKEQKEKDRELDSLKAKLLSKKSEDFLLKVKEIGGVKVVALETEADSPKELRESADKIRDKLGSGVVILGARNEGKAMLICVVTKDLVDRFKAGEIISRLSVIVGGKGGGRPDMAQGGGGKPEELGKALEALHDIIKEN